MCVLSTFILHYYIIIPRRPRRYLFIRKFEGEKGLALDAIQVEIATGDDVHANDGIVVTQIGFIDFLIGDDVARWQRDVHEVCIALRLSADARHTALPEVVRAQFTYEFRGEDGGVAARVPHGTNGFHPPLLVEGNELALGDYLVGQ